MHIRLAASALALVCIVGAPACGSDEAPSAETAATATSATFAVSTLDATEVEFAQGMIAHHQQAIEMADLALDPARGAAPEVVDLAERIRAAQDPEVELMTGWLTAAGVPMEMDMSDGHDMSTMDGMMADDDMAALADATGAEFDTRWLEMMIEHHQGAISQSEGVKADGSNPDVGTLADQIITAQQAEIDEMRALLGE